EGRDDRERNGQRAGEETAPVRHEPIPVHQETTPRRESHADQSPIVLPGESISKYQPQSVAAPAVKPAPPRTPRPSTEDCFNRAEFSPDSMVLPGQSISK